MNEGIKDIKTQVLSLKLRGLKLEEIAERLDIKLSEVKKHDRYIARMMKAGDEEELANMSKDELAFATEALTTMLPYMEKSLDAIKAQNVTLQNLHVTALNVAEKTFRLIEKRLDVDDVPLKDMVILVDMFQSTYNALYNKNGIQIVNLLASTDPYAVRSAVSAEEQKKADSLRALKKMAGIDDDVVDADLVGEV